MENMFELFEKRPSIQVSLKSEIIVQSQITFFSVNCQLMHSNGGPPYFCNPGKSSDYGSQRSDITLFLQDDPNAKALAISQPPSIEFDAVTFAFVSGSPILKHGEL